jgi:glycosyltransferase involved in cell wall biosynthesis
VARWRGAYAPVDYGGRRYGLRVHEFRRFAELPRRSGASFELALDIDPAEVDDLALLRANAWVLVPPASVADTPRAYRRYLQHSQAELMVAKGMYVESRSGWLSERSLCYLACGRPVLAQDTGLGDLYPVGQGLVTFTDIDDASAGVEAIEQNLQQHSDAARALAETHFDSDLVLGRLLDRVAG